MGLSPPPPKDLHSHRISVLISRCKLLQTEINVCDEQLTHSNSNQEIIVKYKNLLIQAHDILDEVESLINN